MCADETLEIIYMTLALFYIYHQQFVADNFKLKENFNIKLVIDET